MNKQRIGYIGVALMGHGAAVEDGTPAALFGDAQIERTRAFLEQIL